jgi:hypothetical protein
VEQVVVGEADVVYEDGRNRKIVAGCNDVEQPPN